ncbi:TniB family NTP-binding protein [Rhizobium laguerreae]|uniref:TniB family NTP-binding protein n=1 Tax=Rhizobium laguerreae TaxID=1076926 RepID=UPI001C90E0D3|nr:TniB family NTP-binding protein [Rhizobium laguerreae]MBY3117315.1 AAA family ATPase [Rhizobium laguerreae]
MAPNITTEFRQMRIVYPEFQYAHSVLDRVREARRAALALNGIRIEAPFVTLFGDSHAGKSTILDSYLETHFPNGVDLQRPDGPSPQRTAVALTLNGVSTYTSFLRQMLKAFADPFPSEGNPDKKLDRIVNYIKKFNVELLIFDEANNLRIRKATDLDATQTHNTLRGLAKSGCPIVTVGTKEAADKILSDDQIMSLVEDISIRELDRSSIGDLKLFGSFCAALGVKLKEHGLFPERSNFVVGNTVSCLFLASGGLRGRLSRLVERAAYIAKEEGATCVGIDHLEGAIDLYSIKNKIISYNPIREARKTKSRETRVG